MKIAYLILAHDQPLHFHRLIKALDSKSVYFFIHIDLKADISKFDYSGSKTNISFVKNRVSVNHGGFSLTQAMITLLKVASASQDFDYFIFLSGRDYPIKDNNYIINFFEQNSDINFINFYPLVKNAKFVGNIKRYHFVDIKSNFKLLKPFLYLLNKFLPNRAFIEGMTPYRGSQWFCLNKQTVNYIIQFLSSKESKKFIDFFKYAWGSDEIFFQTIVLNSNYAVQCRYYQRDIQDSNQFMEDENKAYLHYIDWNPERENPATLDERDFQQLKATDALFARKFDEIKSEKLLKEIDRFLLRLNNQEIS
jgi:hypothetical protein